MDSTSIINQLSSTLLKGENFLREKRRCTALNISSKNWDTKLEGNLTTLKKLLSELETMLQGVETGLDNDDKVGELEGEFISWSKKIRKFENSINTSNSTTNETTENSNLSEIEARTELFKTQKRNPDRISIDINDEDEPNQYSNFDNQQILTMQQETLDEQDRNLDFLSESISRQRDLGINIGGELDTHIELLEETDIELNDTELRLNTAQRRLNNVNKKIKENKLNATIIALVLILLFVLVLAKYFGH